MSKRLNPLYVLIFCVLASAVGAVVGAVAGVGVAGILLKPEEAVVLYAGVGYGVPVGGLVGLMFGVAALLRRRPKGFERGSRKQSP